MVTVQLGKFGLDIEIYSCNISGNVEEFPSLGVFKTSLDNNQGRLDPSSLCEEEHVGPFYMLLGVIPPLVVLL